MRHHIKYFGLLFLLVIPTFIPVKAQSVMRLTLQECLDMAMQQNPRLQLSSLQIEKDQVSYSARRQFLLPEIDAYARYFQYLDDRPVYIFPENSNPSLSNAVQLGAPRNFYSGITINQHLFDARMIGGGELSRQVGELQQKRQQISEDEVYYEVVKTFYQLQIIEGSTGVIGFNKERISRLENVTRTAVENEAVLSSTLDELILRKEELSIQEQQLAGQQESLESYMKFLTGLSHQTQLELVYMNESLPGQVVVPDSAASREQEALDLQIELREGQFRQESASSYPTLDLFMAFQWLQQEGYGDLFTSDASWYNQHMIGLQLNVPILKPDNRRIKKQQAEIDREVMKAQRELLEDKERMEQGNSYRKMLLAGKKAELASRKVEVYQKIFRQESVRYEQAFSSLRDLLDAEEQYRNAEMELAKAKSEYFIAILEMYQAYGNVRSFTEGK